MRQRTKLFALGLFAGLIGLAGCKNTHSESATTTPAAGSWAAAKDSKEVKSTSMTFAPMASSKNCATCRAPGSAPSVAALAASSGCATGNCSAQALPTPAGIAPAYSGDAIVQMSTLPTYATVPGDLSVIPVIRDGMPVANPVSQPVGTDIQSNLSNLATAATMAQQTIPMTQAMPAPSTPPPLGPGVEMVSSGGEPIMLANGDKIIPQSTMTVRFGESDSYQTLVGQVSQFRRTWRLRYTAVESDDKLGGSVILVGGDLDQLKEGQMVRVHGSVLPGDDRANGTRYQVSRLEVIEPGR